ncbi:MAG: Amt family ammonium transporter [Cellvibrionaceae bacterium]|jgi:Amt family ammonium transporter
MGALLIGLSAGFIFYFATQLIKRKFKIDGFLDIFPAYGVGSGIFIF